MMRLSLFFIALLIGATIVESARGSKKKKDKTKAEVAMHTSEEDEAATGLRKTKDDSDKKDREERERDREHSTGERRRKESSSSEEDDEGKKAGGNETDVAKGEKIQLRTRRTQTGDKVQVKVDEHTRARRRKYEWPNRKVHVGRRYAPIGKTKYEMLNDGERYRLPEQARETKGRRTTPSPLLNVPVGYPSLPIKFIPQC
uniref:Secreted protein n=1 Tax=Ascaris lumbricoides TaxID=6252 RepID=A0A9J2PC29_ASCLU